MNNITSFASGFGTALAIGSPVEWHVHNNLMHVPKSKRSFGNKNASYGHQDVHHMAYRGPAHYYQDITNENEIMHFGPGYVALIGAIATGLGTGAATLQNIVAKTDWSSGDTAFSAGFVAGAMSYYGAYELSHHYMHAIGERRFAINTRFGNMLQDKPDGNLRFSKPVLDELCTQVANNVDAQRKNQGQPYKFTTNLVTQLEDQLEINAQKGADLAVDRDHIPHILQRVTEYTQLEDQENTSIGYRVENMVQRVLRNSKTFQRLDNHHFVHHVDWKKNLNVVFPLADKVLNTFEDSSVQALNENQRTWLCPNSPDVEPFQVKE